MTKFVSQGSFGGTESPASASKVLEPNMALRVLTFSPCSSNSSSSFAPLPTLPQTSMTDHSFHVSKIAPAPVISSLDTSAPTRIAGGSSDPVLFMLSLLILVMDTRPARVLNQYHINQICCFLALTLSFVLVRSLYWPDRCLVTPVMLVRRTPPPSLVS